MRFTLLTILLSLSIGYSQRSFAEDTPAQVLTNDGPMDAEQRKVMDLVVGDPYLDFNDGTIAQLVGPGDDTPVPTQEVGCSFCRKFRQLFVKATDKFFRLPKDIGFEFGFGWGVAQHAKDQIWYEIEQDPRFRFMSPSFEISLVVPLTEHFEFAAGWEDWTLRKLTLDSLAIANDDNYWNCPPHGHKVKCDPMLFWHGEGKISDFFMALRFHFHIPFTQKLWFLRDTEGRIALVITKRKSEWEEWISEPTNQKYSGGKLVDHVRHDPKLVGGWPPSAGDLGLDLGLVHTNSQLSTTTVQLSIRPISGLATPMSPDTATI